MAGRRERCAYPPVRVRTTLKKLYEQYAFAKLLPFDDQFEVKPLYYNDKFDALRKKWETAANEVLALMKPGPHGGGAIAEMTAWPVDVTLSELAIEMFFPADQQTAQAVRNAPR
jgi:hypothetical protein